MNTSARFIRPVAALSVASVALLASCGGGEEGRSAPENVSPTNQGSPSTSDAGAPTLPEGGAIVTETAGLTWDPPAAWQAIAPEGVMRQAQYAAPASGDSADAAGECVIFYFGPGGQGGDADANVMRWSQQVLDEQGAPSEPARMEFETNGLRVTTVAYVGTYQSGMPGGPQTPMPNWMLLGAIIEGGPQGAVFVRMTGPAEVVDAHREAWELMVRSFRPAQ